MSIVLFAIIGTKIAAGPGYWICFGLYCVFRVVKVVIDTMKGMD